MKNDIIINCFDEFTYLDNGYYKNLSEGEYEIEIVLTYIEDKVVDVSTSVNRINTAYDNISMHIIDNNGDERVVDLTYLGLFNQCINITFITTFFDEHYISWSTNEKSHNVSLNESFYFEVDGFVLDVKLGRVIKGQYDNYFEIDNETGYIINKFGSFKNRNFYIFFEDDSIYFDLECIE